MLRLPPVLPPPAAPSPPRLEDAVSPYVGLVRALGHRAHAADEAALPQAGCTLADGRPTIGAATVERAGGAGVSADLAAAAAIGEAVERYSATFVPHETLLAGTADEVEGAVDPASFALFAPHQHADPRFPFAPFDRSTRVHWVEGVRLPDGAPVRLPADLVFLAPPLADPPIAIATSNGLACAPTRDEATLGGLLELVERDAVMIAWHDRLSLPRLTWDGDPELEALDARYFAPTRLDYAAIDLSAFVGVPAVLGVVRAPGEAGPLGIGAAAAVHVRDAWLKALSEAFSVRRWARELAASGARPPASALEVVTFEDHILFYLDESAAEATRFVDGSGEARAMSDVPALPGRDARARVEHVCALLAQHGVHTYACDVTAPDVRELGLHVVRVVAPGLCALNAIECARFLGGRRLYDAAYELRLAPAPLTAADLNPLPHPFP